MVLLVNSYFSIEKRINKSAEDYLGKTNDYAISILEQNIEKYYVLLQEQSSELIASLDSNDVDKKELASLSAITKDEVEGLFLLDETFNHKVSVRFNDQAEFSVNQLDEEYLDKDKSLNKFLENKKIRNGKEYFLNGLYYINLYIYDKKSQKSIVAPINLQRLYKNQIKNGSQVYQGYTMIKNSDFVVIMHPSTNQINLNITKDRKKNYPSFDFHGLEKVEKIQQNQEEGTIYYDSYWWDQEQPTEAAKMSVFKWVNIGESRWVVATNSDVKERKGLTAENLLLLLVIFIIIVIVFILFIFILRQYQHQYKVYIKYKESEKRREEERIRHDLDLKIQQESKLETIGIVSTTIVHDLNNILTPLLGMTKLMMEENNEDEALLSDLESIYLSAKKGQELSGNILRFAKLDNKEKRDSDIVEAVSEGVKTIRPLIPKNIELDLQIIDTNYPSISMEPQDIQNILFNLITNAYQAIGKGQGKIIVSVSKEKADDSKKNPFHFKNKEIIVIKVMDNGPGIPKEIQDKVLVTPFYTTKDETGGTGLGLFVVTSLAKKYGWEVKLFSDENGTTFSIRIPI
ncbi:sensor histidine kinase [Vagococcus carniphilus]|uniref:sensor histidine kinase n=1 Tax=Vagococcus carniphilus TaxID=218144 RepID=UPI003BA9C80F